MPVSYWLTGIENTASKADMIAAAVDYFRPG
jgi:hypothetical protein